MLQKQGFFSTLFLYRTQVNLHETVCHRIPGENLEILESKIVDHTYSLC